MYDNMYADRVTVDGRELARGIVRVPSCLPAAPVSTGGHIWKYTQLKLVKTLCELGV